MENIDQIPQENEPRQGYTPRPVWQVWAARVGLVLFILFVIYEMLVFLGAGR